MAMNSLKVALFLLLALSGVWLWARRRNSARTHQRAIEELKR